MGADTKIEWADHTFNPWIGCTKVSPACDFCYAEELMDTRYGRVEWGGDRVRTAASNWAQPLKWNRAADAAGVRASVFCLSLGDIWDKDIDPVWRRDLLDLVERTPWLRWLFLSKRVGNAVRLCEEAGRLVLPDNVALGATMVNQPEWDRDVHKLLDAADKLGVRTTFASVEPMLGPIDTGGRLPDWVIVGGESGHHARPMQPIWVRSLRDQCAAAGVPFLFKQWGEWAPCGPIVPDQSFAGGAAFEVLHARGPAGTVSISCASPTSSRYRRLGECLVMARVGKKAAGRSLDGRTWDEFPA